MLEVQTDVEGQTDTEPTRETWTRAVAAAGPKAKVETETNTQTGIPNMQTSRQAGERSSGRVIERSNPSDQHVCWKRRLFAFMFVHSAGSNACF